MQSYRRDDAAVAGAEVGPESETRTGWAYDVTLSWTDGDVSMHRVRLSWVDHDHWSGGRVPPSRVVEVIARLAAEALGPARTPAEFDASTVRRWVPGLDGRVSAAL